MFLLIRSFFENNCVFLKWELVVLKMGVCFSKMDVCVFVKMRVFFNMDVHYQNGSFFKNGRLFSEKGSLFF